MLHFGTGNLKSSKKFIFHFKFFMKRRSCNLAEIDDFAYHFQECVILTAKPGDPDPSLLIMVDPDLH
jgi:hypothetical protein